MSLNYEIISRQELYSALRKALRKNSKELPPQDISIEEYIEHIYSQLQDNTFKFDAVIKFQLPFGNKILNIDRCTLRNRIVEYALANQVYRINENYWYDNRNKLFRTGSGVNEFVKNAKKNYESYSCFYLIDLKCAFKIDYLKLKSSFLIKNLSDAQISLIEEALFKDNSFSEGLPLGHKLSNILFDCSLINIEKYLSENNYNYLRFIDSFIFFTNDEKDVDKIDKIFNKFDIKINHTKSKVVHKTDFKYFEKEILI